MAKKPAGKMTMKKYENSSADKKADDREAKMGVKEGSKAEQVLDRKEIKKINTKKK